MELSRESTPRHIIHNFRDALRGLLTVWREERNFRIQITAAIIVIAAMYYFDFSYLERIVLVLALVPHLRPQALDFFSLQNSALSRPFSEIGGWRGKAHLGFLPAIS